MSQVNRSSSMAEWVLEHPPTSRVFHEFNLDYCCGGRQSLIDACADQGIDVNEVERRLLEVVEESQPELATDWTTTALTELCDNIVTTHHAYLRRELPRIAGLMRDVVAAHGSALPGLEKLAQVFNLLVAELEPHMMKEESILFPAIRALEAAPDPLAFPFGSVANPIGVMEHEHQNAGSAMAELRALTDGFQPPESACAKMTALYHALEQLEEDLHLHVHKENNILFPRAIEFERTVSSSSRPHSI